MSFPYSLPPCFLSLSTISNKNGEKIAVKRKFMNKKNQKSGRKLTWTASLQECWHHRARCWCLTSPKNTQISSAGSLETRRPTALFKSKRRHENVQLCECETGRCLKKEQASSAKNLPWINKGWETDCEKNKDRWTDWDMYKEGDTKSEDRKTGNGRIRRKICDGWFWDGDLLYAVCCCHSVPLAVRRERE